MASKHPKNLLLHGRFGWFGPCETHTVLFKRLPMLIAPDAHLCTFIPRKGMALFPNPPAPTHAPPPPRPSPTPLPRYLSPLSHPSSAPEKPRIQTYRFWFPWQNASAEKRKRKRIKDRWDVGAGAELEKGGGGVGGEGGGGRKEGRGEGVSGGKGERKEGWMDPPFFLVFFSKTPKPQPLFYSFHFCVFVFIGWHASDCPPPPPRFPGAMPRRRWNCFSSPPALFPTPPPRQPCPCP